MKIEIKSRRLTIDLFNISINNFGYYGFDILNINGKSLFSLVFAKPFFIFIDLFWFGITFDFDNNKLIKR